MGFRKDRAVDLTRRVQLSAGRMFELAWLEARNGECDALITKTTRAAAFGEQMSVLTNAVAAMIGIEIRVAIREALKETKMTIKEVE